MAAETPGFAERMVKKLFPAGGPEALEDARRESAARTERVLALSERPFEDIDRELGIISHDPHDPTQPHDTAREESVARLASDHPELYEDPQIY